jgi:RNA polymerase sigma factor (TIGR02999 family)
VNEAWIRLAGQKQQWQSRSHFFAIAAQAMRRILVDHARRSHAAKREVGKEELSEDQIILDTGLAAEDLIALDSALKQLADLSPRQARVVELRFFAGLTGAETATVLGIARATVTRDWEMAKQYLARELGTAR